MRAIKKRPILFSAPMVRALLDGSKTQTRRTDTLLDLLAPGQAAPKIEKWGARFGFIGQLPNKEIVLNPCRFGGPGDRLWVKETFSLCESTRSDGKPAPLYRATSVVSDDPSIRWRPSIHMPRWASRITLEIVSVRVQRLHDISEEDAKAEGVIVSERLAALGTKDWPEFPSSYREAFEVLWESINGPGSWDANPWVWVIEFKRIKPE